MQDQDNSHAQTDDQDDFGLPEVEYSPIEREDEMPPAFEQPVYYSDDEEEGVNKSWIIAGIIGFFVIMGLAVYLFLFNGIDQISAWFEEPEPAYVAPVVEQAPPVVEEPAPEPEVVEPTPTVNPLAPYQGISTVSERMRRSYIVVASFVDADMAQDFGQQMTGKNVGVKIIQPTSRSPLLHRVAVADFGTFEEAMQQIESFRNEYGPNVWVLKY